MAFTFDPTTDRGMVRLLIGDTDSANAIFDDASIDAFLTLEGQARLAAAMALDAIANSEALIQKVLTIGDLKTDGAKTAAALRAGAQALRDAVDQEVDFDWAEQSVSSFAAREILLNDALRQMP